MSEVVRSSCHPPQPLGDFEMKIAYVTTYDSTNVKNWSGLGYYIAKTLQQQSIDITYIGPLNTVRSRRVRIKQAFYHHIAHKTYRAEREPEILYSYAKQTANKLKDIDIDLIFSPGTLPIGYLKSEKPLVFWTDATYAGMIDFYPDWSNVCRESLVNGHKMEQEILTNCRLAIYSSDWAANTAIEHYQVDPAKIKVVPFGANIESSRRLDDIHTLVANRSQDICKLLFLGVDWRRKGGDIAVRLARLLNQRGLKTELTIAGCNPPGAMPDFVKTRGFIPKTTPEGRAQLDHLLTESHFLVLPSRAECLAIVIAEASSFGVPTVASNVGGIPTAIRKNRTGAAYPIASYVEEAADFISKSMKDHHAYTQLAIGAFDEYRTRLNWQTAGKKVKAYLEEICRQ